MNDCIPTLFYNASRGNYSETGNNFKDHGYSVLAIFTILSAPFLVFPPFFLAKLASTTRKIIAMIILSDVISSVSTLVLYLGDFHKAAVGDNCTNDCEADGCADSRLHLCFSMGIITNTGITCSLVWTTLLFVNLYIAVNDNTIASLSPANKRFLYMNLIGWPIGILINVPMVAFVGKYDIVYNPSYVFPINCRLNFTFEVQSHQCLIGSDGRYALMISNMLRMSLVLAIWVLFFVVLFKARQSYKVSKERALRVTHYETGYEVIRDFSYKIYQNSWQFSIPSIVYAFAFIPSITIQTVEIYNGITIPPDFNTVFLLWLIIDGMFISTMNVLFYGFFSQTFRSEMVNIFKKFFAHFRRFKKALNWKEQAFSINNDNQSQDSIDICATEHSNQAVTVSEGEFEID